MIDPEILSNVKMKQFVGHAPKPLHILSNQVPYDLERDEGEGVPESPMMRGEGTPCVTRGRTSPSLVVSSRQRPTLYPWYPNPTDKWRSSTPS